jgi:glycosyltransferase involved in cell wall biosynthesis
MQIIFFGFGMLELGGGFEDYLITTSNEVKKLSPGDEISVLTASPRLTEKYYSLLNLISFKRESPESLYREKHKSIKKRLDDVNYVTFDTFEELKRRLIAADIIYSKNEIIELILLKAVGNKQLAPVMIGISTPISYPYAPTLSSKLHNLVYKSLFYKMLLRNAAAIKTLNSEDRDYIVKKMGLRNVGVLHHGFTISNLKPSYPSNDRLNVLFAGRLTEQKGIDILFGLIERVNSNEHHANNISFKIAGMGNKLETGLIIDLENKHKNVQYLGHVEQRNMQDLYQWADVTIIPSKFETLNKIAVETALNGKIAISSNIPGPREVIDNNNTGFLVPVNINSFYEKLIEMNDLKMNDINKFRQIGLNAQQKIKVEFDNANIIRELYDIFRFLGENNE